MKRLHENKRVLCNTQGIYKNILLIEWKHTVISLLSQIRYSLVVILELNGVSEI